MERLLYQGNSPTTACVLLLQRINTSLLQVGPFESDPAEKKLVPPNTVLFAYGMLCSPLVNALELWQSVVSKFAPLTQEFHNRSEQGRSRLYHREVCLELLQGEREGDIRSSAFAFDDVLGAFGEPAARAPIVALVTAQEFPTSDTAETSSVLYTPPLATKGKLPHGDFAGGVLGDRCDHLWSEAMLAMPVGLGAFRKSQSI